MHKILTIGLIFVSAAGFGQAKRALNLIEKQKYETTYELLQNGLEKDSTSAAIPFVLAKLFLVKKWPNNKLDSSYYYSILSLTLYDLLDEKSLDKHIKDGFGKTRLATLKTKIDSLAFIKSKKGGKEKDYQQFIANHTSAIELDSAIFLRNEQAYLTAKQANTLSSYKYFIDNYPIAQDWQKADSNYQKILYKESTMAGKLIAYKLFAKKFPASPYYENCVQHIYTIDVGENTTKAILQFVNTYPNSKASLLAIGLLYHLHLENEPAASFADKYPKINISDSLQQVINIQKLSLIPIWKNNLLQLVTINQKNKIDSLSFIDFTTVANNFLSTKKNDKQVLMGKNGEDFYTGKWTSAKEASNGYIFLATPNGIEVVHKNGEHFNAGENVQLIGPFIGFKTNGLWGLKSITNKLLTTATYDSIWYDNQLVFIKQKGKISPNNVETFYPALDGKGIILSNFYDDYEWLTDSLLWVLTGGKEGLYSKTFKEVVPLAKHQIDLVQKGWSITNKNKFLVPKFSNTALINFDENLHWQVGFYKDSLLVKHKYATTFKPSNAYLLGSSAIIMQMGDSSFLYLSDSIRFYKPKDTKLKPLLNRNNNVYYYEVIENKKRTLINNKGEKIPLPTYKNAISLNQHFLQLAFKKSKSLYKANGEPLLKKIEGASLVNDSTISILINQKFGLLIPTDSIYIAPMYDQKLTHLVDSFWVVRLNNKFGVINLKNETILTSEYDEITYWTNGLVFLKKDLKWNIYDLKLRKFTEQGIVLYTSITKKGSPKISYQKGVGTGIYDSHNGVVIKPTFTTIYLEGTVAQPYYRAEKQVEEAALHIMLYYDLEGKLLFKNIMSDTEFELLYGEDEV